MATVRKTNIVAISLLLYIIQIMTSAAEMNSNILPESSQNRERQVEFERNGNPFHSDNNKSKSVVMEMVELSPAVKSNNKDLLRVAGGVLAQEESMDETTPDKAVATSASSGVEANPTNTGYDCVQVQFISGTVKAVIATFGLIGNAVSAKILLQGSRDITAIYFLMAITVSDTLFLTYSLYCSVLKLAVYQRDMEVTEKLVHGMEYMWPIGCIGQMASIYFIMAATVDRYLYACKPLLTDGREGKKIAKKCIVLISLLSVLFNIPRFFHGHFTDASQTVLTIVDRNKDATLMLSQHSPSAVRVGLGNDTTNMPGDEIATDATDTEPYMIAYIYGYYIGASWLLVYIIPIITLFVLNRSLLYHLNLSAHKHAALTASSSSLDDHRPITMNVIAIVTIFLVCQTPNFVLDLISQPVFGVNWKVLCYMEAISKHFLALNASVNFLVHTLFYRRFRKVVLGICGLDQKFGMENKPVFV